MKQTKELFKKIPKKQYYYTNNYPRGVYMMDLVFFNQYKTSNKGYSILLMIIEISTRYLYCYVLKTKSQEEILVNLNKFIQ